MRRILPLRILIVDDEITVAQAVAEYLRVDGHVVETLTSPEEALVRFEMGSFDLVITDRTMPTMSGDQLVLRIKQHAPDVPVLMLTGLGAMMNALEEVPPGVNTVLAKPVTLDNLRQAIEPYQREVPEAHD